MDKENNPSAAGLRRSAIAERIRLREEWSALKEIDNVPAKLVNKRKQTSKRLLSQQQKMNKKELVMKKTLTATKVTSEALLGVVALVEVGVETRALALRAALAALGASVVPQWSPLVTHLVWAQGGSRTIRARARALACQLVSPLWVEACASTASRLSERAFPAAARPSDLPSPRTLRMLLKRAEMENLTLEDLLSASKDDSDPKINKLRLSSETEQDTSTDRSTDKSTDRHDTTTDVENRVNTAPRRVLPVSMTPPEEKKSRRKLFHQRAEPDVSSQEDSDHERTRSKPVKMTSSQRRDLARAERLARKLVGGEAKKKQNVGYMQNFTPRIVLTGVSREERKKLHNAIQSLKGRIQREVTRKTTHVLLGSCQHGERNAVLSDVTGINNCDITRTQPGTKPRTVRSLVGAARGCKVLHTQWAIDSQSNGKWLHHHGYEIPHLKKISQKARVERAALQKLNSEYAYDVFNGMRVKLTANTEQKDAAKLLLQLCGGVVRDEGESGEVDLVLGKMDGEVGSKWVFDSVAAGRMRTARRYVVNSASQCVSFEGR